MISSMVRVWASRYSLGSRDSKNWFSSPRQARERAKDLAARKARARIYQKRDAVEVAIVNHIAKQAGIMREALHSQVNACAVEHGPHFVGSERPADAISIPLGPQFPF